MPRRPNPRAMRKALDEMEVPEVYREPEPAPEVKPIGRPRVKPPVTDQQAVALLCERLVQGMTMKRACSDPGCPEETTVYKAMARDEQFSAIIARARQVQQDAFVDQTIELSDTATEENWQSVRLKIWARQWTAGKLAPKKYGDRLDLNHTGAIGVTPMPISYADLADHEVKTIDSVLLLARPAPEEHKDDPE